MFSWAGLAPLVVDSQWAQKKKRTYTITNEESLGGCDGFGEDTNQVDQCQGWVIEARAWSGTRL